jgi:plastocyanin
MEAMMRKWKEALALVLLGACGGSMSSYSNPQGDGGAATPGTPPTSAAVITIEGLTFSPLNVTVPPGATVTVRNMDGIVHSVTSEAAVGSFSPGAVDGVSFDTGLYTSGDRTITIPPNAAPGTIIPFFCRFHLAMMPQGTITVQAAGTASSHTNTPSADVR